MSILDLFRKKDSRQPVDSQVDRGLLVFAHTSEVIRAEKLLKAAGWTIKVMGPPPEIQKGCDLVVEFPLMEKLNILRTLTESGTPPLEIVPVTGPLLAPVDLFQVKDFGNHIMVRAANMKITVEKSTRIIVNISGGGCPDVPYIATQLIGRTLEEAPAPRDIGHTLCGYALDLAHQEILRQCSP
ncbi:DUF3343 domain-containing protein [Pseudodesulfovibrio tunisiensis]|uniref:DUF3343 domain-containing protein n=1 Tax=Pseudodesulfovibrio tunisiensis TaxID=463192 RepID=UPI001FB331CC|nr:DUF3343 domain-containing protein [Pseudodesulfovibrio tunisiensis]